MLIERQGAFAIGGQVLGDPETASLHCDHGVVEYQIPLAPRAVNLLMWHSASAVAWQNRWDGGEGYKDKFLRRNYPVYLWDGPRVGRANWSCEPMEYVQGADDVVSHVRDCWASLYTTRAVAYREKNNIPQVDVLMSVAVQKMVNAKAAGVAMTLDQKIHEMTGDSLLPGILSMVIRGRGAPAYIGGGETPVVAGTLSELDASELSSGPYSLLLTVVDNSGNFPDPCAIAITVENE